ncbi:hypothetical protein [Neobacillus sp. DY30]|uniref:hypothetical protein n=1 Tax=Neobacillus sp. DY30 TaxID=3047871 RepID=UPI0024BFB22A|nr:hypothetical protein [Neobacillus sp. DY30]WHX98862.1 hypothetical protein QNH29_19955 [Neobacillus sp. DY30]
MKLKIVVSLSIFTLLLSGAWFLNKHQNYHQFNEVDSYINNQNIVPMNNEFTPLNTNVSNENTNIQWKVYMPFRPREYVRIIGY